MKKLLICLVVVMSLCFSFVACKPLDESTGSLVPPETVLTAKEEMTIEVGNSENMGAVVTPEMEITYDSSDPLVATVDETGLVTAIAEGTADITARADGKSVKCVVTVPHSYVYEIILENEEVELFVGGEFAVEYSITADGDPYELADGESVELLVGNDAVVGIENNLITALTVGETTITVKAIIHGREISEQIAVNVVASAILRYSIADVLSEGVEVAVGRAIERPNDPVLEGHEFYQWQIDGVAFDFEAGITEDTVVTAVFSEIKKLVACDEQAITFENTWIQGVTTYVYTTDVKFGSEAGSTAVTSNFDNFDGAWCEPKLGNIKFSSYFRVWFSFSFNKTTNFSFNTADDGYSNWVTAIPGQVYTCIIEPNENEGHVNVWLIGTDYMEDNLWYYNLPRTNLNDAALTHVTYVDEVTMYIGAIWGVRYPGAVETANIQYSVADQLSEKYQYEVGAAIEKPADPVVSGYEFLGWYVGDELFDFEAGITEDTIVTAKLVENVKLVACDESGITFENSWIQGHTTYGYTTDVKAPGEAGCTTVSSNFEGAWSEPKLGDISFSAYTRVRFSFGFDKICNFSFNTANESYSNWITATPGTMYTCIIEPSETAGCVNVWLKGAGLENDLWYSNLEWANLNEKALTHTTKSGENIVTMFIGAIWGVVNPDAPQVEYVKLVASDESAVTFENSWIQGHTTYGYTTDFKVEGEAGSTMVSSDFEGAWCEPKLGDFSFLSYSEIKFSFGFDKACNFSFNTADESYSNWVTAVPGTIYTCIIKPADVAGQVNVWLRGAGLDSDLWYANLVWANLNDKALTHTTRSGENKITMYIGAIWGVVNSDAPQVEYVKLVASDESAVTFENSWIQGHTTYGYTTDFKAEGEAGSTMVSSDFEGAWCEPKLGNINLADYDEIRFSFGFDKACNFSFNTADESYSNWVTAVPGTIYTCIIRPSETGGQVNVWLVGTGYLEGDLWYANLEWSNLNEKALTHTTKSGENRITMYIGAIWGERMA